MRNPYRRFNLWVAYTRFGCRYYSTRLRLEMIYKAAKRNLLMRNHIHTPSDGRGPRNVYLNGLLMADVFYADTKRGVIRQFSCNEDGSKILSASGDSFRSVYMHGVVVVTKKEK